jgi:hypothetical protein
MSAGSLRPLVLSTDWHRPGVIRAGLETSFSSKNSAELVKCIILFFYASHLGTAVAFVRTHTPTQHTHTTHTTRVQTNLQLYSDLKTTFFLRSPKSSDFVDHGHITTSLWLHARERRTLEPSKRRLYSRRINPRGWGTRRVSALEPGGQHRSVLM